MTETDFIAALRTLPLHPGARGLADDAAVIDIGGETLVLTHDSIAADVHFLAQADPYDIAWRLVTTSLSDLAAKGAKPLGVLIGAALDTPTRNARFIEGLRAVLTRYDTPVLGGDSIALAPGSAAVHGLTAIGTATHRPVPSRAGARPGDILWVTGVVGKAMLGYEAARAGRTQDAAAYLRPIPLLNEGQALAPRVHAMMDVSDGLLLDARRMADASGLGVDIATAAVPVADAARAGECMRWGDDYQLLFALAHGDLPPVAATRIGRFGAGGGTLLIDGQPPAKDDTLGYQHR